MSPRAAEAPRPVTWTTTYSNPSPKSASHSNVVRSKLSPPSDSSSSVVASDGRAPYSQPPPDHTPVPNSPLIPVTRTRRSFVNASPSVFARSMLTGTIPRVAFLSATTWPRPTFQGPPTRTAAPSRCSSPHATQLSSKCRVLVKKWPAPASSPSNALSRRMFVCSTAETLIVSVVVVEAP